MDVEPAAAGLCKALGNGQPQAAALGGAVLVPPDEAGRQVVGVHGDFVAGDVPNHHRDQAAPGGVGLGGQVHVHPGALQGVLVAVANQVLEHPVQPLAVGVDQHGRVGDVHPPGQGGLPQILLHLAEGLLQQLADVQVLQIQGDVPRGRLGHLEHVLDNVVQPVGLLGDGLDVVHHVGRQVRLSFQQLHIADDGGQRRLDVVGHVGDKLHLGAVGLNALLHRLLDAGANHVQLHGAVVQVGGGGDVVHGV